MLTKNTYGVNLSNYFNNAIEAEAQNVKPKITIDLLDSRHITLEDALTGNANITNTDAHIVKSEGSVGYYFSEQQIINGYERESFTWAVTDALDKYGKIITADGSWHCMPISLNTDSKLDGDYEFGWWSKTRSAANGVFASPPTVTFAFEERKVNKIRITTSEYYGQVKSFRVKVKNDALVDILDRTVTLDENEYYRDIYLNSDNAISSSHLAKRVEISVISTKNGLDYARIHEVAPIYEVDITDYVIDYNIGRARDVHESNLPIGGTSSPQITIKIDNTNKDWNIFNNNSTYGKYMKKDLKINVSTGWRIKKTNDIVSNTVLRSNMSNVASSFTVDNSDIFPNGGVNNNFIATINPNKENREIILCNSVTSTNTISVSQRGVEHTDANTHLAGSVVQFDPYEYVSMGEFYVNDWASSTSDMTVTIVGNDWSKFLTEKKLTNGFLLESKTIGEAVNNLVMRRNFPRSNFKQVLPYSRGISQLGGVARYSFSEDAIDKNGNSTTLAPGLRCRFWGMREGEEYNYKTIKAEALEKNLSIENRAKGINVYSAPDLVAHSTDHGINYNPTHPVPDVSPDGLKLVNFTFESVINSQTYVKYFNGIVDGYYFPTTSSSQSLVLDISNGGGRIYLDDLLIGESVSERPSVSIISIPMTLTPGVPYRLKIEFFHGNGNANFSMSLHSFIHSTSTKTLIPSSQFRAIVARDGLGARNLTGTVPSSYSINNIAENHHQNDGFMHSNVALSYSGEIESDDSNKGVLLIDDAYIRIPTDTSIAIKEEDFTIELLAKFNDGHFHIGDGEYLSSWANSNPTNGFEFYYNNVSSHGFKIKTTGPTTTTAFVSDTTDLLQSEFYHIAATYKTSTKTLSYYVNGELKDTTSVDGQIVTNIFDTTIGGRGATFSTQEVAPSVARQLIIDEYAVYKRCLTPEQITDRYISSQVAYIAIFPYLYSEQDTLRGAIDEITLADLGRFYIDEEGYGRYEHYNRFFEPSINQHAVNQYSFSDTTNILDSSLNVQIQTNKVVVKVSSITKLSDQPQTLWSANDGVTLGVVQLKSNISNTDTGFLVSTTTNPVFANVGYLAFTKDNETEIVKYKSKSDSYFLDLERGKFGTPVLDDVLVNTKIREARYYEVTYDKKPAVTVLFPISTGIIVDEPNTIDVLKFESNPYTARVIVAASANVAYDTHIYLQGVDKRTQIPSTFQIVGIPVMSVENTTQVTNGEGSLSENIRKYGLKELTIESPYITTEDHAQKLADFIIAKVSDPVPIITINTMCVPKIQLGDRIRITSLDAFDVTNEDYWVISQEFSYGESLSQSFTLRKVV
jgi:hypothetical protein